MKDFAEQYAAHPTYRAFPQERRRAGAVPVDFLRVEQGEVDAVDPGLPFLTVALADRVAPGFEARFHCGDGWFGGPMRRGEILIHPPNGDVHCRIFAPNTVLLAPLPLAPLAAALERAPEALARAVAPLHADLHDDPLIEHLMRALWRAAASDEPASALLVDQGVLTLGAALLRLAGESAAAAPPRLDDRRLARAVEHVEASLDQHLRLGDMAAVAGLSSFHFNRAFKRATGLTPHQYVTARRVERAKRLLAGHMPLVQVAFACGFASQSHFGQVFKAHTGATPGQWREAVR